VAMDGTISYVYRQGDLVGDFLTNYVEIVIFKHQP
jgi:hypothetical protein